MFREWLLGDSMTTEYLMGHLFEKTLGILKEAFATYPVSSENILWRVGNTTKSTVI